jgi:hypothetical protein
LKIVFVHIGQNMTPTLFKAAQVARASFPDAEICLVSDQKNLLANFPGTKLEFEPNLIKPYIKEFLKKNRELKNVAGGYWLNTLQRIFAIIQVARLNPNQPLIHLESDVYLYASSEELQQVDLNEQLVSYPRLSCTRGVASILYSPNLEILESFLVNLHSILSSNSGIQNDMDLLGEALNMEIASELPSFPILGHETSEIRPIFDGAALGQYLLGVNPIHSNGFVVSGFQNSDYPADISKFSWSIPERGKLNFSYNNTRYRLLCLHAHSKEIIGIPDETDERWSQIISEANLILPRKQIARSVSSEHFTLPSLLDRFRIARKKGLSKHIWKYLQKKFLQISRNLK